MWAASPILVWVPLLLAAAGAVTLSVGLRRAGLLCIGAAVTWAGAALVTGPDAAYVTGLVTGPLWPLLAGSLCLLASTGSTCQVAHWAMVSAGATAATSGWWRAAVYQGFEDPDCHRSCDLNPLLVEPHLTLAGSLARVAAAASGALWVTLLLILVVAVRHHQTPSLTVTLPALGTAAVSLVEAWARWAGGTPEVPTPASDALHAAAALGIMAMVSALVVQRVRLVRALDGVRRVLTEQDPVGVAPLLATAMRDRELVVGHRVDGVGYLDRSHRPIGAPRPGRRRIDLVEDGALVAVIDHDARVPPDLVAGRIGPAMRMAIQNEGLQVRLEREVDRLAQARRRLVERGDAERVRLERDLHDGAQQGVLALLLEVGRVRARAVELGHDDAVMAADRAAAAAESVLSGLRDVARGIHPSVLDGGGLQPALRQLADTNPEPFYLTVQDLDGVPTSTQRAAYAIARDATLTRVQAIRVWKASHLTIAVDSLDPAPEVVRDRAATAGGGLVTTDTGWQVHLPCE